MKTINPYEITWVIIEPATGIVTKADAKKMGLCTLNKKIGTKVFANKENAIKWIKSQKASKRYICRMITDKQFGMIKVGANVVIPFTSKQVKEAYTIG